VVQLSLVEAGRDGTLSEEIEDLTRRWAVRLGEGAHLTAAVDATARRFEEWGSRALDRRGRERVAAYYAAVVRRRVVRTRDPEALEARRRLVVASMEADLVDAGWDPLRAADEARRATGHRAEYPRTA